MPTVYLHIGVPKTGTTALQCFLFENQKILEKYGICFPDMGFCFEDIGPQRNAHFLIEPGTNANGLPDFSTLSSVYASGLNELQELGAVYDKIIISDETIWNGSTHHKNYWQNLKLDFQTRGLNLKLIVYLRRQDMWMQSLWAQKIKKTGNRQTFAAYLKQMQEENYPLDYYQYLNDLSRIFGKDALIVRVYEDAQYQEDTQTIFSDFLSIFDIPFSDEFQLSHETLNISLNGCLLEMKRILNCIPAYRGEYHTLVKIMKSMQLKNPLHDTDAERYSYIQPEEREKLLNSCAESNRRLAVDYLNREDGVLFRDTVDDSPVFSPDNPEMTQYIILVFGSMIDKLVQKDERLTDKYFKLAEKNQELKKTIRSLEKRTNQLEKTVDQLEKYSLLFRLKNFFKRIIKGPASAQ